MKIERGETDEQARRYIWNLIVCVHETSEINVTGALQGRWEFKRIE